jgi:SAM-dependent methyltransferase
MTERYLEWKGWDGSEFGRIYPEDALYFQKELQACGVGPLLGLMVGEIGFGNGAFAAWVKQRGGHWIGREANQELRQRAAASGYQVIAPGELFPANSGGRQLDLLVAFDVLEHLDLDTIRLFFKEAKDALRPGGRFLFRVPSGDSPFSGVFFCGDCTHRTLLGSKAVWLLAMEAGLEVRQVRAPTQPLFGLGPLRFARRAAVRALQAMAFSFIRNVLMGEPEAVVSPNMLVVLRKADKNS